MRFRWTLRAQLLGWVLLCVGTVALIFAGLIWREQRSFVAMREGGDALVLEVVRDGLQQRGSALANQLANAVANPLYFLDLDRIGEYARNTGQQADVVYVLVADAQGRIVHDGSRDIARFGEPMPALVMGDAAPAAPLRGGIEADWVDGLLHLSAPVRLGEQRVGWVRLGLSMEEGARAAQAWSGTVEEGLTQTRAAHVRWLLMGLVLMSGFGLIGLYSLRRNVLKPIRALAQAAAAVEAGRYSEARLLDARNDEIGDLTRVFSRMADSVARHERDIRRIAYTDPLTGLGNRLSLSESLESRLLTLQASSGELALMFIDLDDIKRVNDTLGHHVGDELLVDVASRIRRTCAEEGIDAAELARFGGDEFVVLFPEANVRQRAEQLARRILAAINAPMALHDRDLVVSGSIGITVFPDDAASAAQMVKNADMAMYQAKAAGKGCFRFYSRALDEEVERRVRLEHDLRGAWERGEMSLAFQPIFDLTDGRAVGAEALLRWTHPELGLVPPSIFIAIAEDSGQVEVIGHRVLEEAMRAAVRWPVPSGTRAPFVAINVSPRQLSLGDLPETVESTLRRTGLDPHRLHLELTETAILRDEAQATAAFTRLRAIGVGVWLDDFGTGFSGLSHLRRVPVDGVKIDRSFVTDLLRDPNDLALTTGVIAMAHSLGVTVVAEGIENEGQHDLLRERGCPLGQGFYLGRPLPEEDIGRLFG
ncbi:MAG: putative bifunctional diguanylate cyclase/phosphodiesterase [Silanimonas sp.]